MALYELCFNAALCPEQQLTTIVSKDYILCFCPLFVSYRTTSFLLSYHHHPYQTLLSVITLIFFPPFYHLFTLLH